MTLDRLAPVTALWWTETGPSDAPVVLLLHGGGVGAWMWRDQVEALRDRYRVITPDLPGHDHSAGVPFPSDGGSPAPGEIVADLAELLREVAPGAASDTTGRPSSASRSAPSSRSPSQRRTPTWSRAPSSSAP